MRSVHNNGRNGQKLRDVLKEISANVAPQSVSDNQENKDGDPEKSKKNLIRGKTLNQIQSQRNPKRTM